MSDRVIRDELLDSERYGSLTSDTTRMLFVHFLLVADDLGNSEAGASYVRKRLLLDPSASESAVIRMLSELADCDLIRLYEANGKRYAHIPRYRQRLRYLNGKHPRPPSGIECLEIKELISKKSDLGQTVVRPESDRSRQKRSEEKRSEEKKNIVAALPEWLPMDAWKDWLEVRTKVKAPNTDRALTLALGELAALRSAGQDPRAVLEKAIVKGWKSLYPVNHEKTQGVRFDA